MVVGMSHHSAPVDLRERVSLSGDAHSHVLTQLGGSRTVLESVVLSTCNRTEVYALANSTHAAHDFILTLLANTSGVPKQELAQHTYLLQGEAAVAHAMRVACGLDSIVVGETQILGQMREAFQTAFEAGNTGAMFNRMFREVLHVGKRAQSETTVGQHPVSVSYAAVQLASKVVGGLQGKVALVIGAGQMGALAAKHLAAQGVNRLLLANRTLEKAAVLASEIGAQALSLEDMEAALQDVDIVVSATARPGYTIAANLARQTVTGRRGRPLVLLDIAVPRDIDPACAELPNVYLYDVDDLNGVIDANVKERERQAALVEEMVASGVRAFSDWLTEQEVVPLIVALRQKGEAIEREVMASLVHKLPHLSERDRKIIHKHTMSIVNQLLREPIQHVKELSISSGDLAYASMFAQLFGLDAVPNDDEATESGAVRLMDVLSRVLGEASRQGQPQLHPVLR
ncbi:glutamyl-tRNA reductase [Alicyclobacillus sacchari]|nr:glutamyl-tRNA reductase [Alicyclobacillus sacchari]